MARERRPLLPLASLVPATHGPGDWAPQGPSVLFLFLQRFRQNDFDLDQGAG